MFWYLLPFLLTGFFHQSFCRRKSDCFCNASYQGNLKLTNQLKLNHLDLEFSYHHSLFLIKSFSFPGKHYTESIIDVKPAWEKNESSANWFLGSLPTFIRWKENRSRSWKKWTLDKEWDHFWKEKNFLIYTSQCFSHLQGVPERSIRLKSSKSSTIGFNRSWEGISQKMIVNYFQWQKASLKSY